LTWYDLVALYRFRNQVVCVDSALSLTRGNPAGLAAFLWNFSPVSGSFTGVVPAANGKPQLIGQVLNGGADHSARITFIMPSSGIEPSQLARLAEGLTCQAGEWGAYNLLAEVDERSSAFEGLRKLGFALYARQRVWKLAETPTRNGHSHNNPWQMASDEDETAVRSLYQSLTPPLVQSAEPITSSRLPGLICRVDGEILAYVDVINGPLGIFLQPLIHPEVEDVPLLLSGLMDRLPARMNRPVYLAVRTYQAWLEPLLDEMGAESSNRHALLVRHLVAGQRSLVTNSRLAVIEKRQTEPSLVKNIHSNGDQ